MVEPGTEIIPFSKTKRYKKGKERIRLDQTNTYRCKTGPNNKNKNNNKKKNNTTKPSR